MKRQPHPSLSCSFCGKAEREVRKLIRGPTVYICDECILLCEGIIDETRLKAAEGSLSGLATLVRETMADLRWLQVPDELTQRARALALGIETAAKQEEG